MDMINRLRFRHIRAFLKLYELGSVTEAAKALNTVQPALSRTLRELETELGQPLFERSSQGLIPTDVAETFKRHVTTGMAQIERGVQQVKGLEEYASVAIGIMPNVARTLMPPSVIRFKQIARDVDVRVFQGAIGDHMAFLQRGELDFLAGRLLSIRLLQGITFEPLYSEPLVFAVRADHPLATVNLVTLEMIDQYMVVVPELNTIIREELDRFIYARGISEFSNKVETVSFDFARELVATSSAVSCFPLGTVRREFDSGDLVRLSMSGGDLVGSVGLFFLAERGLSPAAAALVDIIREEAEAFN